MNSKIAAILLLTMSTPSAFAADEKPSLGEPTLGGSGCKKGTVSWVLSPDDHTLSILFDDYRVEAGNGTRVDVKECTISIPIQVPSGHFLTVFQVDYRGFNSLPKGAASDFDADYEFQGGPDPKGRKTKPTKGPVIGDFIETTRDRVRSFCGGANILNIHTTLKVQTNAQQDQAISQIDSKDMTVPGGKKPRKMQYKMELKKCNEARR